MTNLVKIAQLGEDLASDFRAKATFGVAMVALALLLPLALADFYLGKYAIGIGASGIVFILGANAWMVTHGKCHQKLTLFGLVPAGMLFMTGVFQNDGIVGSLWCYPTIVCCYCMLSEKRAWIANCIVLAVALPMSWLTLEIEYSLRIWATLGALSLFSAILVRVIDEQRQRLQTLVITDSLTGLLNRHTLKDKLQHAVEMHAYKDTDSSLIAIDIDYFKQINDTYGHDCGDQVLQNLGNLLRDELRRGTPSFRIGGEEFLVLLEGTGKKTASDIAERLRHRVENSQLHNHGVITVSIGVATLRPGESWSEWSIRCDQRLYAAKHQGRNKVVGISPPEVPSKEINFKALSVTY